VLEGTLNTAQSNRSGGRAVLNGDAGEPGAKAGN